MAKRRRKNAWDSVLHALARMGHQLGKTQARDRSRTLAELVSEGAEITLKEKRGPLKGKGPPQRQGEIALAHIATLSINALGGTVDEAGRTGPAPNTHPIVAVRVRKKDIAQLRVNVIPPLAASSLEHVFYAEIEPGDQETPNGVGFWIEESTGESARIRIVGIWTRGWEASAANPLIVSMRRETAHDEVRSGATRAWTPEAQPLLSDIAATTHRHSEALSQAFATIAVPAIEQHINERDQDTPHQAIEAKRTREIDESTGKQSYRRLCKRLADTPIVRTEGLTWHRSEPPEWAEHLPSTALDAVMMSAALDAARSHATGERLWSEKWWAQAELGAIMWQMGTSAKSNAAITAQGYKAIPPVELSNVLKGECPLAIRNMNNMVFHALNQTSLQTAVHISTPDEVQAVLVPDRLWRAIDKAGPHPELPEIIDGGTMWYIEIEAALEHEPSGIGLWLSASRKIEYGTAIWTHGAHGSRKRPLIIAWADNRGDPSWTDEEQTLNDIARVGEGVRLQDNDAGLAAHMETMRLHLHAEHGIIARAKTAIHEHIARGEMRALALVPKQYRESTMGRTRRRRAPSEAEPAPKHSIFALVRAPNPVQYRAGGTEGVGGAGEARGPLTERQTVEAHWKRQAYGPRGALRKIILIDEYERGPEPEDDEIALTRLAEEQCLLIDAQRSNADET